MVMVVVFLACSSPALQAANSLRGNVFLEMMLAMMDFMGFIDRDRSYYNQSYPNYNQYPYSQAFPGTGPWQSTAQALAWQQMLGGSNPVSPGAGMSPFSGPGNWSGMGGFPGVSGPQAVIPYLPEYFNQQQNIYQPGKPAVKTHWIEGRWIANDNMIMEVRQGKFIMYYRDDPKQVRGGLIRLKDRWLAIAEQTRKITRQYEYAYKNDVLVLRDTNGNLMLFKRLTDWPVPLQ